MSNLATRVKKLRLEKSFSQTQLADKLGISYMNIANFLWGFESVVAYPNGTQTKTEVRVTN